MSPEMDRDQPESTSVDEAEKPTEEITSKQTDDVDIKMKYILALQEAQMWKQRYLSCTQEKSKQLANIEKSLMVLEARLQAERKDIERKFNKQNRALKEQKRKIAKLTTANQKLLTGLMALSEQAGLTAPPPYSTHKPPEYMGNKPTKVAFNKQNPSTKRQKKKSSVEQKEIAQNERLSVTIGTLEGHKHYKALTRTQRSKSLPLNRHTTRLTKSTEC